MVHRRRCLTALAGGAAAAAVRAAPAASIQLHVDLDAEPSREKQLAASYRKVFYPAIRKQPGFIEAKLLKLRSAVAGPAPANASHRLILSFQTEEQRLAWVKTEEHQRAWPTIEENLRGSKYSAVLYEVV